MRLKLVSEDGPLTLVDVNGRITPDAFSHDNEPLAALLGPGTYERRVLLGLASADYINSSGVGWLLVCHKRFREAGGRLILHSVPQLTRTVLEVLKMDQVFQLAGTLDEARELANQGTAA